MLIKSSSAPAAQEEKDDVLDDVNEEAEGLEDDVEDVEAPEEDDVENEDEETPEEEAEDSTEDADKPIKFDKNQQARIDQIVKDRLERQEVKMLRDVTAAAGVEISREDVTSAARLWGLLKSNPKLSRDIDGVIANAIATGTAVAPAVADPAEARTQKLELKEAILDLKEADSTFSKNADKILAWAEKEGYMVKDEKSLKLVYRAWKGTQGKVTAAIQKTTAQRKQEAKKTLQKQATVQSSKSGGSSTAGKDYRKMSDKDVLLSEGLSLFTKD